MSKANSGKERLTSKRQQDIMDAAVRVFSRKGFNGATTKEIAREAGVAEGTIFRYFKTKKDILLSLACPFIVNSLVNTMEEVSGASDEVVLRAIVENRITLIKENLDLIRLLLVEAQFHPEIMNYLRQNLVLKASGVLEEFIDKRTKVGAFKKADPAIAARMLVGMVGVFVLWNEYLFSDSNMKIDEAAVIENVIDIFLNGIRNREGED